jgi:hypothetical protein
MGKVLGNAVLKSAYHEAGPASVDGFRRVMRGIMDDAARAYIDHRASRDRSS